MPSNTYFKHILICPGIPKIKSSGISKLSREDYAKIGLFLTLQDPFEKKKKKGRGAKWRQTSRLDVVLSEQIKSQKRTVGAEAPGKGCLSAGRPGFQFHFPSCLLWSWLLTLCEPPCPPLRKWVSQLPLMGFPEKIKWEYPDKQGPAPLALGYLSSPSLLFPSTYPALEIRQSCNQAKWILHGSEHLKNFKISYCQHLRIWSIEIQCRVLTPFLILQGEVWFSRVPTTLQADSWPHTGLMSFLSPALSPPSVPLPAWRISHHPSRPNSSTTCHLLHISTAQPLHYTPSHCPGTNLSTCLPRLLGSPALWRKGPCCYCLCVPRAEQKAWPR